MKGHKVTGILFSSIGVIFFVLMSGCNPNVKSVDPPGNSQPNSININPKLDSFFLQKFKADEPGGAVLVIKGDSLLLSKGYGISDIKTREAVTARTLFNLGSVSKTFVANAILILQARNQLSVEDSLVKYFPEFRNKDIGRRVKIKHLLTHTSGLPDIRFPWKDSVFYLTAKDKENWEPILKVDKLNFEPGSQYEYSNPAFNALALIIESVSGEKWQNFVSNSIFAPSGMSKSTITDGAHPQTGVAHGYIKANGSWIEKDYGEEPTFAAAGNGGVWSSIEELALYERALIGHKFLDSLSLKEATTVQNFSTWSKKEAPNIGWSWFIGETMYGHKTVGHTGSQGGFRANYLSIPEEKWLIVMLSSTPHPLEDYTNWVLQYLHSNQ